MIHLTPNAVQEVKRLQAGDPANTHAALRVKVMGGGCSGMQYKLGLDTDPPSAQDKLIEQDGLKILVDGKSALFLEGMEVDYTSGFDGRGFVFNNPTAKRTCGCGSSFST